MCEEVVVWAIRNNTQATLATLLYAFFENIDFNVILCTNVTKDVLK
jgi:hypothetical protein